MLTPRAPIDKRVKCHKQFAFALEEIQTGSLFVFIFTAAAGSDSMR